MVVSLGPPIASYAQPRSVPYVLPAPYNQDQVARQNTQYRSLTLVRNIWHRSFHHQSTTLMGWTCPQSAQWQDPEGCLLLWTAVRFQVSRSSKAALQRQLEVHCHRSKTWEDLASDRSKWRITCLTGVQHFEENRIASAMEKRRWRKDPAANPSLTAVPSNIFPCNICGRRCTARIGLTAHMSHRN